MARAPFQVLVFPYRKDDAGEIQYALFSRADYACWQGIAGGGEDAETPLEAAKRESLEEAGISADADLIQLDTVNSIPAIHFKESYLWGEHVYVIPEYAFGVHLSKNAIELSVGHKEFRWVSFEDATAMLTYDGNKTALWELNRRLLGKGSGD